MQTVRSMRDTVLGSSKLQKHMGLIPDPESTFQLPLWPEDERPAHFPGSRHIFHGVGLNTYGNKFDGLGDYNRQGNAWHYRPPPDQYEGADIRLEVHCNSKSLGRLGSRTSDIVLCQPPIQSIDCYMECSTCGLNTTDGYGQPIVPILPDDGRYITVGDVHRTIVRMTENHEVDCDASRSENEECGLRLNFFGEIEELAEDDPLNLFRARETMKWRKTYGDENWERN